MLDVKQQTLFCLTQIRLSHSHCWANLSIIFQQRPLSSFDYLVFQKSVKLITPALLRPASLMAFVRCPALCDMMLSADMLRLWIRYILILDPKMLQVLFLVHIRNFMTIFCDMVVLPRPIRLSHEWLNKKGMLGIARRIGQTP